ncbi:hemerythrin family protein [Thiohalobacter sp. IOR34]|uniref:bacteriohemerythrin n=1 Tax=Thiohalobacter sp. IOR34 TaxID=3057176 RepID=UPI0025B210AA|nr:hemerythrin family protein [Thiohalobacter sp. IOR34]WJW74906.1 hemerythrin family protein [Thiohalobacter sp. IOR34]
MPFDHADIPLVALDQMNDFHREEVEMINRVETLARSGDEADLAETLREFLNHIRSHFATEEALMQAAGFPPFPIHKQEHDRLLAELGECETIWMENGDPAPLVDYICRTIPQWMQQHVATMDRVTAQFLAMTGAG